MIDLTQFEALTFDCYGTMIDWEKGILAALEPVRERYGIEQGDEAVLASFAKHEAARETEAPNAPYPEILDRVYCDLADEWDIVCEKDAAEEFANSVGGWPAFGDSHAALAYLKEHFVLGVLSNVDRASFELSQKTLGVEFDEVMTAEEIGSYKPDLANFRYALDRLAQRGIEAEKVLHVAQSLYHDHVPAQELGMKTVWVDRRHGKSGSGATKAPVVEVTPDLVVEDLARLVKLHKRALKAK